MNIAIDKKVFIVTGASSGIGEEICKQLSKKGALVVCAARRKDELDRVSNIINNSGGVCVPIQTDISVQTQCQNLINKTLEEFNQVDGLVLNAGISMWARFDDITNLDFFKKLMDVNYFGAVNCVHSALPHLKKTKGVIVSCSTAQALMGFPRHSGYAASKHALHGFLSTIAIENKKEINILEAVLGWIRGTNLRDNAFGPTGEIQKRPPKHDHKESVDLDQCVSQIVFAIEKGKRTIYIPKKLKYIPFLRAFATWYLEERAEKAVEKSN